MMQQHWASGSAATTSRLSLVLICVLAYAVMAASATDPLFLSKVLLGDSRAAVGISPQADSLSEDCEQLLHPVSRLAIVSSLSLAAGGALTVVHPLTSLMLGVL
mmetsp:Transcript_39501/g.92895  ORF Transcript_39501/g.92895 Transcript_39501/m.92895 type:complete len:104 (+) Transcript_39501:83-394(+)|eukprot:CAMPEP_0178431472 /NCGR_PEP_ID=MMETSP0689_2-20121128/31866_1 /TAXON_ID=160604 /ORGANISM="Amphidinium massartii, Strain CS-259" /LENGTH=103 /DNA_ID=CAMNT_0020053387 /DNA_START=83 /DNA_END=394 /DNA_ORIENTATION=+